MFTEAWEMHLAFKKELEDRNFQFLEFTEEIFIPEFLLDGARMYLDYLSGENLPSHEIKKRSQDYINTQRLYIERFIKSLKSVYSKTSQIPLHRIGQKEVGLFHDNLKTMELSDRSYNAHMTGLKYFFKYLIEYLGMELTNPFDKVVMRQLRYDPQMITDEELEKFFEVITEENGREHMVAAHKKKQHYRPWLRHAFLIALLTGERLDNLIHLKWKDVKGKVIGIPN